MGARSSGEIRSSQYRGGIFVDRKQGYDREYRIKDGHLFDLALNCPLDPWDIHIDTALRLESRPNAGDASVVYAILDQKTLSKGLLIDVFDIFDEICDRGLAERLVRTAAPSSSKIAMGRYGLRKVYKNEFDRDPERYVLRIGYTGSRFRCSASIRPRRHMLGSSQAYSGIRD